MSLNPFIALYDNPVAVLTALGYTVFLVALTLWTLAAAGNVLHRGWTHVVWLSNAWEWRDNAQQFGPEWSWYFPPKQVAHRVSLTGVHFGGLAFLLAVDVWAIAAVVYVLSP